MKKSNFLILLALIFFTGFVNAQFKPGDVGFNPSEFDIYKKAKVKTQTQLLIDTTWGYTETTASIAEYTTDGWLLRITYTENLEYEDTIIDEYTYFPDGRIRIISLFGYDLYPIEFGYEYDKKNKLIASNIAAAEARRYTYEYDKSDNIIKRLGKTNMFQYDDEGNLMEGMIWVDNEESTYTWNDKQQLLSELFYMQGEFYYKIIYEYNPNGSLNNYKVFYDTEQTAMPAYASYFYYNEKNLLIKMIMEEEGSRLEYKYVYSFN